VARAKTLTLAAMSLGFGVVQLDVTIVNTALNSIGSAAGASLATPAHRLGFSTDDGCRPGLKPDIPQGSRTLWK
jgi:hypothetical protein